MASALLSYKRGKDVCSETSVMASKPTSVSDLPDEVLMKILSYVGPEDLCLNIAKVCEKWNVLAKDVVLWKTLSYKCDRSSDISRIAEVRCTTLLVFSTNYLTNFAPSSVLKVQNLKEHFINWTSSHPEVSC
jgi:hypothetical protein